MNALETLFVGVPQHGVDHWDLVEYEWNPKTGVALLVYEHDNGRVLRVQRDWQEGWPDAVLTVLS